MNTLPYSMDDLYWFARIAEAGGLSRAAREFDVAKSSLSRRLARLEAEAGVTLVQRNSNSSSLTEIGRQLVDEIAPLFRQLESMTGDLLTQDAIPRGLVRVSASGTFGKLVVLPLITTFMQRHSSVNVELELIDRKVDIVAQGFDLAVRIGALPDSSLVARRVTSVSRILCASPAYVRHHGVPKDPEELAGHACLLQSRSSATIELFSGSCLKTVTIRGRLTLAPSDQLLIPTQLGLGISPLAEIQVADLLARGELVRILPDWAMPPLEVYLMSASRRYRPTALRLLIDKLVEGIPQQVDLLLQPLREKT